MPAPTFYEIVSAAVRDIAEHGYLSPEQLAQWARRIREAAERTLTPQHVLQEALRASLSGQYRRLVDRQAILAQHKGIPLFTLDRVKPKLRAELDRRIVASADLIKLNRVRAVDDTEQRFAGWASSVPAGGSKVVERRAESKTIRKALASLPFTERRVAIDQASKFSSALSDILAKDGGAIAAIWNHRHVRYPRAEHLARDGKVFLIRDSWAYEKGLVKPGPSGFTDEIERPAEFVYCRCDYQFLYSLRALPPGMITQKGRETLGIRRVA